MQDLKRQQEPLHTFSWKNEMKNAEIEMVKRIIILEQTGNVECTIRTKRNLARVVKKIKEMKQSG